MIREADEATFAKFILRESERRLRVKYLVGESGPYIYKTVCHVLGNFFFLLFAFSPCRSEVKKTKVKKKTNNPQFDEVFYFEVGIAEEWLLKCNVALSTRANSSILC